MELRDYQSSTIARVEASLHRRIMIQSPTGSGKTVIACELISRAVERGQRALFIAHREELINQAVARLKRFGIEPGVIMADDSRVNHYHPVQVASIATLAARRMAPPADVLIIDEAHRSAAESYSNLMDKYPRARIIGLSAAPVRQDDKPLGKIYDEMICVASVKNLIERGHLVRPQTWVVKPPEGIAQTPEQDEAESERLYMGAVADHVKSYAQHGIGRRGIIFAQSVDHSQALARSISAACGVAIMHLDGTTPAAKRREAIIALRTGTIDAISNVGLFVEGFDEPGIDLVMICRNTKSLGAYIQMGGRGLRTHPGKADCKIIDCNGSAYLHGAVDDEREWSLSDVPQRKPSGIAAAVCHGCGFVFPKGLSACPECGRPTEKPKPAETKAEQPVIAELQLWVPPAKPKKLQRGELETAISRCESHEDLVRLADRQGYLAGWAWHIWKAHPKNPAARVS
jgi:superfamily II DNA or RNA helicase